MFLHKFLYTLSTFEECDFFLSTKNILRVTALYSAICDYLLYILARGGNNVARYKHTNIWANFLTLELTA